MNDLKQNAKITLCAITASLSTAIMLVSYFPYLTYAVPAVSGLVLMMPLIEINYKWSLCAYVVSGVLSLLIAEPESASMFVFFFGYYPIVKSLIERINKIVAEWLIKIGIFNIAVVAAYLFITFIMGIPFDEFGEFGKYGLFILLALGNVVFVVYDIAISRMSMLYMARLHKHIAKYFK